MLHNFKLKGPLKPTLYLLSSLFIPELLHTPFLFEFIKWYYMLSYSFIFRLTVFWIKLQITISWVKPGKDGNLGCELGFQWDYCWFDGICEMCWNNSPIKNGAFVTLLPLFTVDLDILVEDYCILTLAKTDEKRREHLIQ